MKFDLHVHTSISPCSRLPLHEILNEAYQRDLAGVCITDHDTMEIRNHLREGIQTNGLCVLFGMEYSTRQGDFLLFGPFEELQKGLPAKKLLRHVAASGGVAIAAHPFRRNRSTAEWLVDQGLCEIVEGINGRNQPHENDAVNGWSHRYGVKKVGGSDAHTLDELGQVTTRFFSPIRSRYDLIQALKSGQFLPERNALLQSPFLKYQAA